MHKSQESAGLPVFASSSAAPLAQPAHAIGAAAPVWLSPLLHEIGHHALNARDLLARLLDADGDDDALNMAAANLLATIGMLADAGLARVGETGVMGGPTEWLVSPVLGQALRQDGAVQ